MGTPANWFPVSTEAGRLSSAQEFGHALSIIDRIWDSRSALSACDQPSRQRARVTGADTGEYLSSGPFRQVRRRLDNALFNEVIVLTLPSLMWVGAARLSAVMVMESSFRRQLMHTLIALAGGL